MLLARRVRACRYAPTARVYTYRMLLAGLVGPPVLAMLEMLDYRATLAERACAAQI